MKDQYFGDVNDYRKYGLLRALGHAGFKTLVVWMLTPNDGRSDGRFTDYLDQPSHWKHYDEELYDALHDWVKVSLARRVASIEHSTLLTAAIAALSLAVLDPPVQAQDKTVPGLHWSEESRQVTSPFATSRKEIPQWKQ